LNLADNSLADLEVKVFQMLTKLKILDLSRNPLEDLQPDVFKDVIVSNFYYVIRMLYKQLFQMFILPILI